MIKLESKDYYKAILPLSYVNINTMFAEAIVNQVIPGIVYVDCVDSPRTFHVVHPYGMSLLFGESDDEAFKRDLFDYITNKNKIRHHQEWLQVDPAGDWTEILDSMYHAHNSKVKSNDDSSHLNDHRAIIRNTRVNFSFNRESFLNSKESFRSQEHVVVPMTKERFLSQAGSVNPKGFWRDSDHFLAEGVGYNALCSGNLASTAFSAFRNEHELEIGIETTEAYRGQGFAYAVCSALISYCLAHRLEPVWACRLDNQGSYKLAQRLGFETSITIPYYRLVE